jgi:hypothetical protein
MPKKLTLSGSIRMSNVDDFLSRLCEFNNVDTIVVDLKSLSFIELVPLNILLAQIFYWKRKGHTVTIDYDSSGGVHTYLQRMDFYNLCGLDLDESFTRQNSKEKFCVIKPVMHGSVGKFSSQIADIIAPSQKEEVDPSKTGFYDFVEYAVSELINNVNQHAIGKGFISAQYYPSKGDMVQICIADIGIGIRNSFLDSHSPLSSKASSDREAIELALSPEASSKTHIKDPYTGGTENKGVGLTILREIIVQTGSNFVIVSGEAGIYISNNSQRQFTLPNPYKGTIVGFSFHRTKMGEYEKLLEGAKVKHGLGLSDMPEALSGIFEDGW